MMLRVFLNQNIAVRTGKGFQNDETREQERTSSFILGPKHNGTHRERHPKRRDERVGEVGGRRSEIGGRAASRNATPPMSEVGERRSEA